MIKYLNKDKVHLYMQFYNYLLSSKLSTYKVYDYNFLPLFDNKLMF